MRNTQLKEKKQVSQSEGLKMWKKEVARQHGSESEVDIENEKRQKKLFKDTKKRKSERSKEISEREKKKEITKLSESEGMKWVKEQLK